MASLLASALAGGFINILYYAAEAFQEHSNILVWFIPLAGLALALVNRLKYFRNCEQETSPALTPYMYITSFWSHLFGASVGREGAAIQIGASMAEFVRRRLKGEEAHRLLFAHAGVAAAFCVALGTPLSAVMFALEYKKEKNRLNFAASLFGSFIGWLVMKVLPVHHWQAPSIELRLSELSLLGFIGLSLGLWLLANSFVWSEAWAAQLFARIPTWSLLAVSGLFISGATLFVGHTDFNNFGTPLLDHSFIAPTTLSSAFGKIFFTFVSLTGGWKGGAFVPLMVGGGMVASWASFFLGMPTAVAAGLGVFAVVHRKFNIPLTSALITGELFGWKMGLLAVPIHMMIRFFRPKLWLEVLGQRKMRSSRRSSI